MFFVHKWCKKLEVNSRMEFGKFIQNVDIKWHFTNGLNKKPQVKFQSTLKLIKRGHNMTKIIEYNQSSM